MANRWIRNQAASNATTFPFAFALLGTLNPGEKLAKILVMPRFLLVGSSTTGLVYENIHFTGESVEAVVLTTGAAPTPPNPHDPTTSSSDDIVFRRGMGWALEYTESVQGTATARHPITDEPIENNSHHLAAATTGQVTGVWYCWHVDVVPVTGITIGADFIITSDLYVVSP